MPFSVSWICCPVKLHPLKFAGVNRIAWCVLLHLQCKGSLEQPVQGSRLLLGAHSCTDMAVLRVRASLVSQRVEVCSHTAHFTVWEPTTRNGSAACHSNMSSFALEMLFLEAPGFSLGIYSLEDIHWCCGVLTKQKCYNFALLKPKNPTNH